MEPIFYEEAAELLGVTPGTLYHAISRKVLTRLPRKGQKQCLIKEQVLLFKGKRLSLVSLSRQDMQTWRRYADEANSNQAIANPIVDEDVLTQIVRQEILRQEREEAEKKAAAARENEERFHKEHPFLVKARRELQTA